MDEKGIDMIAEWVLIVGAINWGLALFSIDLVKMLLSGLKLEMIGYGIVGVAGVWALLRKLKVL